METSSHSASSDAQVVVRSRSESADAQAFAEVEREKSKPMRVKPAALLNGTGGIDALEGIVPASPRSSPKASQRLASKASRLSSKASSKPSPKASPWTSPRPSPPPSPPRPLSPRAPQMESFSACGESASDARSQAVPHWSFGEAFGEALRRARDEGVDLYAAAPQPLFMCSARSGSKPKLQAPHMKATGCVREESDICRLDACLTRDYFARPAWNTSTLPYRAPEDHRSLESIARDMRVSAMRSYLRPNEGREEMERPQTSIGMSCRPRGDSIMSAGVRSSQRAQTPGLATLASRHTAGRGPRGHRRASPKKGRGGTGCHGTRPGAMTIRPGNANFIPRW